MTDEEIRKVLDEALKKEKEIYESIKDYTIEIGVITADSTRKQVANVSITNAELMFIHENGSALRKLPARPVLQIGNAVPPLFAYCIANNTTSGDIL